MSLLVFQKETFIVELPVVRKSFIEIFGNAIPAVRTRSWPLLLYRNDLFKHKAMEFGRCMGFSPE
jgi:hypothetical protein